VNKPLARRAFLKAMAAAPLAADEAAASDAFKLTGANIGPMPAFGIGGPDASLTKLLALYKTGMLPDWFVRRQRQEGQWNGRIEPDVACLRSVALSAKFRIQEDRSFQRRMANFERETLDALACQTFWGPPSPPGR